MAGWSPRAGRLAAAAVLAGAAALLLAGVGAVESGAVGELGELVNLATTSEAHPAAIAVAITAGIGINLGLGWVRARVLEVLRDMDSDALIQRTVREAFAHCTTLTIAHRLNTIMDSDKVAFLDAGRLTEFGEPSDLLKDANGSFTKLVEQSGKKNASFLVGLSDAAKEHRASRDNLAALERAAEQAHRDPRSAKDK